jgi:glutathione S-transferase
VTAIIFHHYPNSPFAEKIRLIFGFKKLAWNSVLIPAVMPKPDLTALTGGYRRTPVMQIGADIYCDTALIADVLERIAPSPTLYPPEVSGLARTLAQWADTTLFWTAMAHSFQPGAMQDIFRDVPAEQVKAFLGDRTAMRSGAPRLAAADATGHLVTMLRRLEHMLSDGRLYLLGAQPTIADFSVYHPLWFVRRAKAVAAILDSAPTLLMWHDRMAAIGHQQFDKMSAERAIGVARESKPVDTAGAPFIDIHGVSPGDRVAIMPTDYALDPVEGELALATQNEFAIRRSDERAGTVVVHFPRLGFQLKKI